MEIVSKSKIKQIKGLKLKKKRDEERLFVIEGNKIIHEVLADKHAKIAYLVGTSEFLSAFEEEKIPLYECSQKELKELSSFTNPSDGLAVVHYIEPEDITEGPILALDDVQDPGNFGTILRTADWFNIRHIVCSQNTVDIYNPKVIQSTMGSFLRMKVEYCDLTNYLQTCNLPVYGALLNGENAYTCEWKEKSVLLMGNEGKGISPTNQAFITNPVTIPRFGATESLNVGIATGILLSEIRRVLG